MTKIKKQIFIVHGGETFSKKADYLDYLRQRQVSLDAYVSWKNEYLDKKLGADFQIIRPRFPAPENAKYEEWKIVFESYLPLLKKNFILIGISLGGIFLARYLAENKLNILAKELYLVAAPYDNTCTDEELVGGFRLPRDLSLIEKNCQQINLLFSEDDDCVPVSHAYKYLNSLQQADLTLCADANGHFRVEKLPVIVKMLRKNL